mmetsp:Transcript_4758/g.4898  ORF Transcript_4758/g.4898 Transcript_4758/m.4898 type:complete len:304 (+) Transcript_4758:111-1022(+)
MTRMPIRFVIVDNSGSMIASDGQMMVSQGNDKRYIACSRWAELTDSLRFHAALAEAARAPTEFRLLNNANPIMLGIGDDNGQRHHMLLDLLEQSPGGGTPLCRHIHEIITQITALAPQLRANGQRAGVVIATDGESSDGDVAAAMAPLKSLPAWVTIRLCTGEDRVCEYWNNIDSELELEMDVLDDLESEAKEIRAVNDWLTYGEPLHRLREAGFTTKEMDLLDETMLSPEQLRTIIAMLFTGGPASEVPHPAIDFKQFLSFITPLNEKLGKVWCPLSKSLQPWIRMSQMKKRYGKKGKCVIS